MIRATHKTIRDYWGVVDQWTKPAVHNAGKDNTFRQVINSIGQTEGRGGHSTTSGLTIQDYWRQPVAAQSRFPAVRNGNPQDKSSAEACAPAAPAAVDRNKPPEAPATNAPSAPRQKIERAVKDAAAKYGLPAGLVASVIRHESAFNPRAVSKAGAQGLMQLMPATAKELGVEDPFDIRQNVDAGSRYLKQMLDQFDGDLRKALAAYNAGPGTVRRYGGIPPYPETRNYVHKVMKSAAELV